MFPPALYISLYINIVENITTGLSENYGGHGLDLHQIDGYSKAGDTLPRAKITNQQRNDVYISGLLTSILGPPWVDPS